MTFMKNHLKAFGRGLILAGLTLGAIASGYPQSKTAAVAPKRCLMWKAVNGPNVVYLVGSIHIGSKDMYPLPKVMEDAFTRASVLAVELDITKDQGETSQKAMKLGTYEGEDNLWNHISKETADRVKKSCEKYGLPESMAGSMKPWLLSVTLSLMPMLKAGMDPTLGIDKHFLDKAHSAKTPKKIVEVESADFQLKTLSNLPDNLSDIWMKYTIGEADQSISEDAKVAKLWKEGNSEALAKSMLDFPKEIGKFQRSLLEDRNPHMTDVAEKYLKGNGPCFFVVGAAHLVGPEGVVALLKKRGYTVFQISAEEASAK